MAVDLRDRGAEAEGDELDPAQQHYDDVFNDLTSQEHMAKDGTSGDTGAAEAEKQNLFNPTGDTASSNASASGSSTSDDTDTATGGGADQPDTTGINRFTNAVWGNQNRRRTTVVGTVIGLLFGGGILGSSFLSGPLGFMQIAHTVQQAHLLANEEASQSRLVKIYRFARYNKTGTTLYKTRLGLLGNQVANIAETRLNSIGLTSEYSPNGVSKTGLKIDSSYPEYRNKSPDELKTLFKDKYGVDISPGERGGWRIDSDQLGFLKTRSLNNTLLQESGVNKGVAAIQAHVMGERDGITWHPLKKLDTKVLNAVEKWWVNRTQEVENGTEPGLNSAEDKSAKDQKGQPTDPQATDTATANQQTTQPIIDEASQAGGQVTTTGSSDGLSSVQKALGSKIGKGVGITALGTGLACMARAIAQEAPQIKETQVNLPLIRMGMEAVTVGAQMTFGGQDIEPAELGKLSQQWYDSTNHTSWATARPVQAFVGEKQDGPAPNETLKSISGGSPFDVFNEGGIFGAAMGAVCNPGTQIIVGIVGFLGGPISATVSTAIGYVVQPKIVDALVHWAAGKAIDPNPRGSDYGYDVMYGGRLAANEQALSQGGVQLSSSDENTLTAYEDSVQKADFGHQSLAYRLFDPVDIHSAFGSMLSHMSPSTTSNMASLTGGFLSLGHTLASLPINLFSSVAHAGTPSNYDYGFPKYGFSINELQQSDSSTLNNPFANGDHAADLLDAACGSGSCNYINEAKTCFHVQLTKDSGSWDVQNDSDPINTFGDEYKNASCDHPSGINAQDWLSIRFFILDTETMKSEACYDGDSQSCSDEGMGGSAASSTSAGASSVNGYDNPLRDVKNLAPGRIDEGVDYSGEGPVYAIGNGKVVHSTSSDCGWPACNWISYTLSDGPAAGKTVYMAENCTPAVSDGQTVTSTTVICHMHDASPNIETGWASPSADVALAASVYHEGAVTAYGVNFNELMKKLGAPDGTGDKSSAVGSLPAGWPTTW